MSKPKNPTPAPKPSAATKPVAPRGKDAPAPPRKDGVRETVESVVIAFVLAFLFRAFEAEAFVIPTGSMAPTLMGVHKDLTCDKCGFPYRVGASEEQDDPSQVLRAEMSSRSLTAEQRDRAARELASRDVVECICPNCRYAMNVDPETEEGRKKHPTYKGDRILVAKFPYDFSSPRRWDVAVFKYPQTANENFIKRVIGLPNETVSIHGGDIYTGERDALVIERKPPDKVRAIMQTVYDNDFIVPELVSAGMTRRWQPLSDGSGAWQELDGHRAFRIDGSSSGEQWLGYQHRVPTPAEWQRYKDKRSFVPPDGEIRPQLVSDFYAYNAERLRDGNFQRDYAGSHWVGDLTLECDVTVEPATPPDGAAITLRSIKGGRSFDCRIDTATGAAHLAIDGVDLPTTAATRVRPGGTHQLVFANVDCQLLLWVDGGLVEFSQPTTYEPIEPLLPTEEDLTPFRIGSKSTAMQVEHLHVLRDVYYVATATPGSSNDYDSSRTSSNLLAEPAQWARVFARTQISEPFVLGPDDFLMLGDNSPRSKDSRAWTGIDDNGKKEYYVNRDLLVGKAVFIYWPHSWNRVPGTSIPFPYFPNFGNMKLVR